jgi:hypothetical protein
MNISPQRLWHLAGRFHALGPRSTYELLKEVVGGAPLVERYAELDPEVVRAVGADQMPPTAWQVQ